MNNDFLTKFFGTFYLDNFIEGAALLGVLAEDPRPPYQDDPTRVYGMSFAGLEVRFTAAEGRLTVREIDGLS